MTERTTAAERSGRFQVGNAHRFTPGQSGNPGGASSELVEAKRAALRVLVSLLHATELRTQIAAALAILSVRPRRVEDLAEDLTEALRNPAQTVKE